MSRPVVDLPQPDSPTRPREPPRGTWKETPSTACTWPMVRRRRPDDFTGKYILRSSTSSTAGASGSSRLATWPVVVVGGMRISWSLYASWGSVDQVALAGLGGVGADLGGLDLGSDVGVLGHRISSTRSGAISGRTSVR